MEDQSQRFIEMVAGLASQGADGRAGLGAVVREIEARYPGEIQRLAAALELQKLGCKPSGGT
jgi:hypothetical protein